MFTSNADVCHIKLRWHFVALTKDSNPNLVDMTDRTELYVAVKKSVSRLHLAETSKVLNVLG